MSRFEQLDYVYMPSRDVAADVHYFTDVLGVRLVFAVEGMGTRVAMLELSDTPPRILLAGHLEGEVPVLVYRVRRLASTLDELQAAGWERERSFEIPQGPVLLVHRSRRPSTRALRADAAGGRAPFRWPPRFLTHAGPIQLL